MLKKFKFYKNAKGEWYLDLPDWTGNPEDLQMIQGADEWLELLSNGNKTIEVEMRIEKFENADVLSLMRIGEENLGGGGNYYLEKYKGQHVKLKVWLCEVTKFIFGEYPQKIYFLV